MMATLTVNAPDYSENKQKALEEAKIMQASIVNECTKSGKDPPPYSFLELIGKGSFGRVYKATTTSNKPAQLVAIKVISIEAGDILKPGNVDTFGDIMKEINTLKLLGTTGAKNINPIIDSHLVGHSVWMVTEYCAGGSVASLMRPAGYLPEIWIIPILREVAEAIYWIHKQGIIHRDIKCANVLIADTGCVQLCDFGVAAMIDKKFNKRTTVTGTLPWMAPELFDSSVSYGSEVDIWAFGSMAFELASGMPPNAAVINDIIDFGAYLRQHCPRLEGNRYSPYLKDFVSRCIVVDPAQRPTIDKVQKHPYIHKTSKKHPTSSLSKLVNSYKVWEAQGGIRRSLFSGGGAQPLTDHQSPVPDEEWSFPTMDNLDHSILERADDEAIYHPRAIIDHPVPIKPIRRRPLPPNSKALPTPLDKILDPNATSNYKNDVQADCARLPPLPNSPLRDDSSGLTLRASSLNRSQLPQSIDLGTIKAQEQHDSSDMVDSGRRPTLDWTFPTIPPPSTAMDMAPSQPNSDEPPMSQSAQLHPADNYADSSSTGQKALDAPCGRDSAVSLIDLDAFLLGDTTTDTETSNIDSDAASASSNAKDTPLDFEPLMLENPSADREPSLYVSVETCLQYVPQNLQTNPHARSSWEVCDFSAPIIPSQPSDEYGGILAPLMPCLPSPRVMHGFASQDEVKDEFRRMLSDFSEQLEFTAEYVMTLPVRRGRYGPPEGFF